MSEEFEIRIVGNSKEAQAALKLVSKQLGNLGDKVKNQKGILQNFKNNWLAITAVMGTFIIGTKKAVDAAANIEDITIQFETMLGSAEKAKKMMEELKIFSASTPFALDVLAEGTKTLVSFGVAAEDSVNTMRMLGDTAGGNSEKLRGLVLAYGKVQTKGKASMEEINMIAEKGVPIIGTLVEQLGVTEQEFFKLVSAGKIGREEIGQAFKTMTSEGGMFFEGMEKQSQTFNGIVSTMKDNVSLMGAAMVEDLMPILKVVGIGFSNAAKFITNNKVAASALIGVLTGLAVALVAVKLGLIGIQSATILGAVIAGVIAGTLLIIKNWDKVVVFFQNSWAAIKFGAQKTWGFIKIGFLSFVAGLISAFQGYVNFYINGLNVIINASNKWLKTSIGNVKEMELGALESINNIIDAEKKKNKSITLGAMKTYKTVSDEGKKAAISLGESGKQAGKSFADNLKATMARVKEPFEKFSSRYAEIGGQIKGIFSGISENKIAKMEADFEADQVALDANVEARKNAELKALENSEAVAIAGMNNNAQRNKIVLSNDKKRKEIEERFAKEKTTKQAELEREKEMKIAKARVKQFNLNKTAGMLDATISTAGAVVRALANPGGFAGIALAVVMGLLGIAQIAVIASQQAPSIPSFAEGAIVGTPTTAVVGDNPNEPEIVAPISKAMEMMGAAGTTVIFQNAMFNGDNPRKQFKMLVDYMDSMGIRTVKR